VGGARLGGALPARPPSRRPMGVLYWEPDFRVASSGGEASGRRGGQEGGRRAAWNGAAKLAFALGAPGRASTVARPDVEEHQKTNIVCVAGTGQKMDRAQDATLTNRGPR
jgi:hypothetical protein